MHGHVIVDGDPRIGGVLGAHAEHGRDELPRNPLGKILKRELRDELRGIAS